MQMEEKIKDDDKEKLILAIKSLMQEKNLTLTQVDTGKSKGKTLSQLLNKGIGSIETARSFYDAAIKATPKTKTATTKKIAQKTKVDSSFSTIAELEVNLATLKKQNAELLSTIADLEKKLASNQNDSMQQQNISKEIKEILTSICQPIFQRLSTIEEKLTSNHGSIAAINNSFVPQITQETALENLTTNTPKILGFRIAKETRLVCNKKTGKEKNYSSWYAVKNINKKRFKIYLGVDRPRDEEIKNKIQLCLKTSNNIQAQTPASNFDSTNNVTDVTDNGTDENNNSTNNSTDETKGV
jgi:hypothetical protein